MKLRYRTREALYGFGFIGLWIIGFLVFTLYPLFSAVWLGFNKVVVTASGFATTFTGLKNYVDIITLDLGFITQLGNYLGDIAFYIPVVLVFSMAAALLLNRKIKGRMLFRAIFFLPVIITSGPVITMLSDPGQNALNLPGLDQVISTINMNGLLPDFLVVMIGFLLDHFVMILWYSGVQILIFLSALQKQDPFLYESASIDGASAWEMFWKLTLPSMNQMIIINILYTIVTQSVMSTNPIITMIVNNMDSQQFGYGYSSAMAWIYFIVMLVIIGVSYAIAVHKERKISL